MILLLARACQGFIICTHPAMGDSNALPYARGPIRDAKYRKGLLDPERSEGSDTRQRDRRGPRAEGATEPHDDASHRELSRRSGRAAAGARDGAYRARAIRERS